MDPHPANLDKRADLSIRPARTADAGDLAELVVMAGHGLPLVAWEARREAGETVMDVGRRSTAQPQGGFSFTNADLAIIDGEVAAAIICYPLPPDREPVRLDDVPPMFRPLEALENRAVPSWYVNVLATYEQHRRKGVATALLDHVAARASAAGYDRLSVITGDANPALHYYRGIGFEEAARDDIVKQGWEHDSREWVLMLKPLG